MAIILIATQQYLIAAQHRVIATQQLILCGAAGELLVYAGVSPRYTSEAFKAMVANREDRENGARHLKPQGGNVVEYGGGEKKLVGRLVREELGISGDTAARLGKFFKTSPEFWMNLQARYDVLTAQGKAADALAPIEPYDPRAAGAIQLLESELRRLALWARARMLRSPQS